MGVPRAAGAGGVPPGVELRVVFDRTPAAYLPGSSVTGRVILTLEQQLAVTCEYELPAAVLALPYTCF